LDQSGATVAGARVSLIGVDTGVKLSTESNDAGLYRFDAVDLGVHQLQVAQPGFRTYLGAGMHADANCVTTLNPGPWPGHYPANGGRGQLGYERPGKHGRPILD